jgi:hypothetical protein
LSDLFSVQIQAYIMTRNIFHDHDTVILTCRFVINGNKGLD